MVTSRTRSVLGDAADVQNNHQSFSLDPPPFGVGSNRFGKLKGSGPAYHAAYGELTCAPQWNVKGWAAVDDPIRRGRGTCGGLQHSSMAAASEPPASGSSLQPMFATYPNETRLKELLDLHRRRTQAVPPPGSYQLPGWNSGRSTFRRPAMQSLDGPFPAASPDDTTRVKEMAAALMLQTAAQALGPGEYDVLRSKAASSGVRNIPAHSISQSAREGRTPHLKSLSISRSLQHGIDWHVPVIVQVQSRHRTTQLGVEQQTTCDIAGQGPCMQAEMACTAQSQLHYQNPSAMPHYMAASPVQHVDLSSPPTAPVHVARNIPKKLAHQPGAWNWGMLDYNYRHNWTTLHGGPYLQGYKKHLRRAATAPACSQLEPTQRAAGGDSNHEQLQGIFPITEESSLTPRVQPQEHGQLPDTSLHTSDMDAAAQEAAHQTKLHPTKLKASHRDLIRHAQARQAGELVQQAALRQTKWASRLGQNVG